MMVGQEVDPTKRVGSTLFVFQKVETGFSFHLFGGSAKVEEIRYEEMTTCYP